MSRNRVPTWKKVRHDALASLRGSGYEIDKAIVAIVTACARYVVGQDYDHSVVDFGDRDLWVDREYRPIISAAADAADALGSSHLDIYERVGHLYHLVHQD
ncbi:hypothetical protein [Candidatus Saccharimonas aalborgensis]|uniref:hypothetical protein n=1 Tax=Candidatus Saccharimonas aalborgensis TaxID=1332188 RepID=UPI001ED9C0E3|nr:hypothetical protein [Candidatus Saccharimonas aalborgensis]